MQVKAPIFVSKKQIDIFLEKHQDWIQKQAQISERKVLSLEEIAILKAKAEEYIPPRVEYFAQKYGFYYKKIRISSATTRWGSCSSQKTLSFSYRLMQYGVDCIDYVIIHELCHLREMNHSHNFWKEVEAIMPDYKEKEKLLKIKV